MSQKFCSILVGASLHVTKTVQAVIGSIVVVGVLTCYALLHSMFDLKAAQMNVKHILIQELILYKFKQEP